MVTKYLFSLDNGKTWSDALAKTGTEKHLIWMGMIPNYSISKQYTVNDIQVYRKFNLQGAAVIPVPVTPVPPVVTPPTPTPLPPTPLTHSLFTIDVLNFSNESDADIKKWTDACKKQADRDVSKFWGYGVDVNYIQQGGTPVKNHAYMGIFNNSDQAGILGWHDVGPNNEPLIKIFTKESERFSLSPSGTISHEICESIGDANASTTIKGFDEKGRPCLYYQENCDPCENELYQIDGVDVSDFVTPAWFNNIAKGPYDFLGKIPKPFIILQGGYMEISYDNGSTWTQVDKFSKHAAFHQTSPNSRWALYKKPEDKRVKSTFNVDDNNSYVKGNGWND